MGESLTLYSAYKSPKLIYNEENRFELYSQMFDCDSSTVVYCLVCAERVKSASS